MLESSDDSMHYVVLHFDETVEAPLIAFRLHLGDSSRIYQLRAHANGSPAPPNASVNQILSAKFLTHRFGIGGATTETERLSVVKTDRVPR